MSLNPFKCIKGIVINVLAQRETTHTRYAVGVPEEVIVTILLQMPINKT